AILLLCILLFMPKPARAIMCHKLLNYTSGDLFDEYAEKTPAEAYKLFRGDIASIQPNLKGPYQRAARKLLQQLTANPHAVKLVALHDDTAIRQFLRDIEQPINPKLNQIGLGATAIGTAGLIGAGAFLGLHF